MPVTKTFRDLGVDSALCDALAKDDITHPFPIQELTLPLALAGHDLIGQARTGTGKTLAFGLPLLQRLDPTRKVTQALVVVPTRELCLQVFSDLQIGASLGLRSISVYGGVGYDEQIDALTTGVHVVVGTPGRLLDHLNRGNLDLSNVTQLVLDEADEMLDMGFLPDVERLVEACTGTDRHTMLFSATMPTAIVKLARRYMDHPTFTRADHEARDTSPDVEQHFFQVHRMDKPRLLARILQSPERGGVYVFVRTKHMADRLVNDLEELNVASVAVHGDLRQTTRERNLDRFRSGEATVLVCTEVAARGLDVSGVTHVVNYDCPDDEKMYLHRIGRTARAGAAGVAVTFAEFNEIDRLNVIRKAVGATESTVEAVFSTSPQLAEWFNLPAERPWDALGRKGGGRPRSDKPSGRKDGERRSPRSDGKPKGGRRREGRGGAHDADRSPAGRSGAATSDTPAETTAGARRTRSRPAAEPRAASPETAAGDRGTPATSDGAAARPAARTRTRARTRAATGGASDRPRRSPAADGSSSRSDGTSSQPDGTSSQPDGTSSQPDGNSSQPDGTSAPQDGAARGAGGRTSRSRAGASTDGRGRGHSGDDAAAGPDRQRDDGDTAPAGARRRGRTAPRGNRRDQDTSGTQRKGSRGRAAGTPSTEPSPAAEPASPRGSGRPQRARRVRVEHLP